jgi:uncharacterized protein
MTPEESSSVVAVAEGPAQPQFVIDCDVHPLLRGGLSVVLPYLSDAWRRRLEMRGDTVALTTLPPGRQKHPTGEGFLRREAIPPDGGVPGSDPEFVRDDLLDAHGVARALLLPIQAASVSWWTDGDEASALVSAYNDHFAAEWLPRDERFRMSIVVAPQNPDQAAAEIRRYGADERFACVWLPMINILMGNRFYDPIYDAAQEFDLPIMLHPLGGDGNFQGMPTFAGGVPRSYSERYAILCQIAESNLSSAIFEGLFERFPRLRVVFAEYGWAWLPPLMWRMDATWKALRIETPWLQRAPSEYIDDHVRFTSEPAAEIPNHRFVQQVLEMMHAERTLMFSSDYPHWDSDDPETVFQHVDPVLADRIMRRNAIETFPRLDPGPNADSGLERPV